MTVSGAGFDTERAEGPGSGAIDREGLRFGPGFVEVAVDVMAAGAQPEAVKVGDVIGVGVRDEDAVQCQTTIFKEFDDGAGVCAGVEGCGAFRGWIPDDVGVNGHVAKGGIETGETSHFDGSGEPRVFGEGDEGGAVEVEGGSEGKKGGWIRGATLGVGESFRRDLGSLGQGGVRQTHAALGFGKDIIEEVFEGDHHRGM